MAEDRSSGAAGATAHDAGVRTSHDGHTIDVGVPSMVGGKPYPPQPEQDEDLCRLETNPSTRQWEVWTTRDGRDVMLFSSGFDHERALDHLALYEAEERALRQPNEA